MLSLGTPKIYQVGPYTLSTGQMTGGQYNDISLGQLPRNNQSGVGICLEVEITLAMTIAAGASDPAVPWYQIHRLVDMQLVGANNFTFVDEQGWHAPIRESIKNGRFVGAVTADYPASTASGTRTLTRRMTFLERGMKNPMWRCLPIAAFRGGKLRVWPWTSNRNVNGTSVFKLTDLVVTAYFKILDVDPRKVPIGAFVTEGFLAGQLDQRPSPGLGQFLRCANVIDPATASIKDDLAAITKVTFGTNGATGYTMTDQNITQLMRRYADEYAHEPKKSLLGTLSTPPTDAIGFLDPVSNNTGRLHAIPLVLPARGCTSLDMPSWEDVSPVMKINDDSRSGTPSSLDFIADRIVDRDDGQVRYILDAVAPGKNLQRRYTSADQWSAYAGRPGINHRRAPLVMDLR